MKIREGILLLCLLTLGCARPVDQLTCGDGTTRDGARCIGLSNVTCSAGTRLDNGACIPDVAACAAGTHLETGQCVLDATACAEGTTLVAGRCVLTSSVTVTTRWKPNVRVCPASARCYDARLATDGQGNLFVAYSKELSRGLAIGVAVSNDDGATFTERGQFEVTSNYALNPSISADEAGNVLVVYTEYEPDQTGQSNGAGNIWARRSSNKGLNWSAAIEVTPPADMTLDYKPLLSTGGSKPTLLFLRYGVGAAAMLTHSDDQGATWSAPVEVGGDPGSYGRFQFVHGPSVLPSGELMIGYQSLSYDLTNGGYLSHAGVLTVSDQGVMSAQSDVKDLAYSSSNSLDAEAALVTDGTHTCFVFVDAPSRDYSLFSTQGPITSETKPHALPLGPGTQVGPSVALGPSGECHLAWLDNRRGGFELWAGVLKPDGSLDAEEPVSDTPFFEDAKNGITTLTDLKVIGRQRYAVWNDTRDGAPAVYFARGPLDGQ